MEKVVIIGGGVAGLSCLNALLDHDISPLLLEGGQIGTPKMCGEFLAPSAVRLLHAWDIHALPIAQAEFFSPQKNFLLDFPEASGAIARSTVEILLAQRARAKAGRIQENALIKKVIPATATSPYLFQLASGEEITAKTAIFATGKYDQHNVSSIDLPYVGIKTHFDYVLKPHTLFMQSLPGAYFGVVPISEKTSNCTCLVKRERIQPFSTPKKFFSYLVSKNNLLQTIFNHIDINNIEWLEGKAARFRVKKNPAWPNAFWIGDTLAGLHPAVGSGFSLAINSAMLAAEFFLQSKPDAYLQTAIHYVRPKFSLGKLMHQVMLNPMLARMAFPILQSNTRLLNHCLKKLDYL